MRRGDRMTRKSDLTLAHAQDLAHYFLGPTWIAAVDPTGPSQFYGCWLRNTTSSELEAWSAPTWRAVFRAAGVKLPVRPQFAAHRNRVMSRDKCVGVMATPTFAARTAHALNEYEPNARGL